MTLNQLSHTGQGKPCPFYFSVIVACSFWSHDTYQTHGKAVLYIRIHTCFPWTNDPTVCQALCQTMNLQEPRFPGPALSCPPSWPLACGFSIRWRLTSDCGLREEGLSHIPPQSQQHPQDAAGPRSTHSQSSTPVLGSPVPTPKGPHSTAPFVWSLW